MKKLLPMAIIMAIMLCVSINTKAQTTISLDTGLTTLDIGQVRAGQSLDITIPYSNIIDLNNITNVEVKETWEDRQELQMVGVAVTRHKIDVKGLLIPTYAQTGPIDGRLEVKIEVNVLSLPITYILDLPIEGEVIP